MGAYWCASDASSFDNGPTFTLPESDFTIENPGDNVRAPWACSAVARHGCTSTWLSCTVGHCSLCVRFFRWRVQWFWAPNDPFLSSEDIAQQVDLKLGQARRKESVHERVLAHAPRACRLPASSL
jgi:hypothetical protein